MNTKERQVLSSGSDEFKTMKQRLIDYKELNADIDNCIDRLERLEERMYNISPKLLGDAPSGGSSPGSNKVLNLIEKKEMLESKIDSLIKKRDVERKKLEDLVELLKKPNEKMVIYLRYFDDEEWDTIIEMMFGDRKNFYCDRDNYKQKTFRLHSSAIANMSMIVAVG